MNLKQYASIFRERKATILVAAVIAAFIAALAAFVPPPKYTATLAFYVASQTGQDASQAYQGAELSQDRVISYVQLIPGQRVLSEVARELSLQTTVEDLQRRVSASSKENSVVIDVNVVDDDPVQAARIANSVGAIFPRVVDELERPASPRETPPVVVRVVQPAAVPITASSVGWPVILFGGMVVGLLVGLAAALVRNSLDSTIKSTTQLSDIANATVLGSIRRSGVKGDQREHLSGVADDSLEAESTRQLRTNLQYIDVDHPPQVVTVSSSVPSEGKSTVTALLGSALAATGRRVLVVEADLRRPSLSTGAGLHTDVGLTSILTGRIALREAVQHLTANSVDVLASGPLPPNPSEMLASEQMSRLLRECRNLYDMVLIDTPPILPVTDALALAPETDGLILLCRYGSTTREQLLQSISSVRTSSVRLLGVVLTMAPSSKEQGYSSYGSYETPAMAPSTAAPDSGEALTRPSPRPKAPVAQQGRTKGVR